MNQVWMRECLKICKVKAPDNVGELGTQESGEAERKSDQEAATSTELKAAVDLVVLAKSVEDEQTSSARSAGF